MCVYIHTNVAHLRDTQRTHQDSLTLYIRKFTRATTHADNFINILMFPAAMLSAQLLFRCVYSDSNCVRQWCAVCLAICVPGT